MNSLFPLAYQCLMQTDPERKLQQAGALWQQWQQGMLNCDPSGQPPPETIPVPGRPPRPVLVHSRAVKQRKLTTTAGRIALLHAVAHIEFNAINLALDAAYRFRDMPADYYGDWLQVAAEEALHFSLVRQRLRKLGADYGDLPAHNGLWEQACKTDHDPMVRMALVPRVLEARGLDVTPGMMERLRSVNDTDSVEVLAVILRDEIGHVRIGSHWFRYLCRQRGLEPESTFRQLLREVMQAPVRGPFYTEGRLQAGFSPEELEQLLLLERHWQAEIRS
ncbi:MAG: ferritin-like domain-containing protein [Thiothrix sp.]|nr:ferritin-like domain-containing protein [Thiothrix sp.]HPE58772.1 ferritin-like domain-containing protein [Thiolinea sp.]